MVDDELVRIMIEAQDDPAFAEFWATWTQAHPAISRHRGLSAKTHEAALFAWVTAYGTGMDAGIKIGADWGRAGCPTAMTGPD